MRDHERRTRIRLLVLSEESERIAAILREHDSTEDGFAASTTDSILALHIHRFAYFADLPGEFRECNPEVPWRRLRGWRARYDPLRLGMPRSVSLRSRLRRIAQRDIPEIAKRLSQPKFPKNWRNEPHGQLGISDILTPHRAEIWRLLRRCGVRRLRVYGSVARGEADDNSDVDLLVDWRSRGKFGSVVTLQLELEKVLGRPVEIHTEDSTYWAIRERVLSEAVELWRV